MKTYPSTLPGPAPAREPKRYRRIPHHRREAPISPTRLRDALEVLGGSLTQDYGGTEQGFISQEVPLGTAGEICTRSVGQMSRYTGHSKTAEPIRDDWLRTGDIGYLDDAGFLGRARPQRQRTRGRRRGGDHGGDGEKSADTQSANARTFAGI